MEGEVFTQLISNSRSRLRYPKWHAKTREHIIKVLFGKGIIFYKITVIVTVCCKLVTKNKRHFF